MPRASVRVVLGRIVLLASGKVSYTVDTSTQRAASWRIRSSSSLPKTPCSIRRLATAMFGTLLAKACLTDARSLRNAPSRRLKIPPCCTAPRPGHTGSSAKNCSPWPVWSMRLRPTWSEELATSEINNSLGVSRPLAATTKYLAVSRTLSPFELR